MKDLEDVTFIIKTCERPMCIKRLVKSIIRQYGNTTILIADDSRESCKQMFKNIQNVIVYELKQDSGLAYGRNYLIDRIKTKYFVLCDDDFEFDKRTDIKSAIKILEQEKLDILGGYFRNYEVYSYDMSFKARVKYFLYNFLRKETPYNHIGTLNYDRNSGNAEFCYISNEFPYYEETDIVHNFFIAKTNVIRDKNRWKDNFKLGEHVAFFLDAKEKGLKVGFTNKISVRHKPVRTREYAALRDRDYVSMLMETYEIRKLVIKYDGVIEKILER